MRAANSRMHVAEAEPAAAVAQFAADVRHFLQLQPRQLPSRYLYDPLGSALFDAICRLPWYPLTRGEFRLLGERAAGILSRVNPSRIVELGAGNGDKLSALVAAAPARPFDVHLIDISRAALEGASRALSAFEHVRVFAHEADYEQGLAAFARERSRPGRTLLLFLGSNIGNYDPPGAASLLRAMRTALGPGQALLLGADLVKPREQLLAAYDDPLGVTAAFNRNLLVRINRELGGDIALDGFGHRAVWNEAASRVEMHLVSRRAQRVRIRAAALDLRLAEGESIWTESSYKYRPDEVKADLESAGFRPAAQWIDPAAQFSLTLAES